MIKPGPQIKGDALLTSHSEPSPIRPGRCRVNFNSNCEICVITEVSIAQGQISQPVRTNFRKRIMNWSPVRHEASVRFTIRRRLLFGDHSKKTVPRRHILNRHAPRKDVPGCRLRTGREVGDDDARPDTMEVRHAATRQVAPNGASDETKGTVTLSAMRKRTLPPQWSGVRRRRADLLHLGMRKLRAQFPYRAATFRIPQRSDPGGIGLRHIGDMPLGDRPRIKIK
jgi:hypothetical protein